MTRRLLFVATLLAVSLSPSIAHASVWFEVLYAPCWTGSEDKIKQDNNVIGRYDGAIDCFNKDFNGGGSRTVLSIKAFQAWEYGTMFLYYDITGPWNSAVSGDRSDNERGGLFGGISLGLSPKRIIEKRTGQKYDWGFLADVQLKYELEHVSKFGMINFYGLEWSLKVPGMDSLSVSTVARDDWAFKRVDLQLRALWRTSFSLGSQDFRFDGFISWGLFGEGKGKGDISNQEGNQFFLTQPQLLWDVAKNLGATPGRLYVGAEWQIAWNRYLIEDKTENVLQGMIRWNI